MDELQLSLNAIQKKLIGKQLSYKEIFAIMDEVAGKRLGDVLTTYFAASGYASGFSDEELFFLTKAMVETGEKLHFSGIVADKHSIGGVPGTRTTLIIVPIIAAAGFIIPKSSSRAITTPDGTADDMEILAGVTFSKEEIYKIVKKVGACIVWGGSVDIAPADDVLIQVEKPLMFESYDKIVVSIMAKKIAFGSNHVVIDIPYGKSVKVHSKSDAQLVAKKFEYIAGKFKIKLKAIVHETNQPAGRGIGPVLETRESLRVLEQHSQKPIDLEERSLILAGELLDLCLEDAQPVLQKEIKEKFGSGRPWAKDLLYSGKAHQKMMEIIAAQGGNAGLKSDDLKPSNFSFPFLATHAGVVTEINSKNATAIAKIAGAPEHNSCGIYLEKKIGDGVEKGDTLFTVYGKNLYNLKETKDTLAHMPIYTVE